MKGVRINIVGLHNKVHHFEYEIGDAFFAEYGTDLLNKGDFTVHVTLDKHETFLETRFRIVGTATLTCDRSLDAFAYPIEIDKMVIFKYGEETKEISDEVMMIHRDTVSLELGQYIYEFIGLAIPMKKLHPRFEDESEEEDTIVYSSAPEENAGEETDPRWEKLKKLK